MASGYDISLSASSGLSSTEAFYNMSGISFGNSRQSGSIGDASGGTVTATASRSQEGSNAASTANALASKTSQSEKPMTLYIVGGIAVVLLIVLFFVVRKKS